MSNTLVLPAPLPHQLVALDHEARFKVFRWGRRTGKSRAALLAAIDGHGPRDAAGEPQYPGVLQGAHGVWLTPDYPQSRAIWREEIRPRFAGLPGVTLHETERRVEVQGLGSLEIRSAESIDNVRGRRLDFVICDEAAHFDLEYAWHAVVRPALADREGWALVISTPNAGPDGNSAKVTPSYFNRLCVDVRDGKRGSDWREWHYPTETNVTLPPEEIAQLRQDYPPESATAQQELDALLVAGGLMALVIDRAKVLLSPNAPRPAAHWRFYGAFDWGFSHPWSFGLFAVDEDGTRYLVDAATGRRQTPDEIGREVAKVLARWSLTFGTLPYTAAGHDCWHDRGRASGENTPTFAQKVMAQFGWALKRANIARVAGLNNIRDYLTRERFKAYRTAGVLEALAVLESRITDPDNPEDVLKQDADSDGRGGDDPYDMVRYGLAEGMLTPTKPSVPRAQERAGTLQELARGSAQPTKTPGWRPANATTPSGRVVQPNFRPQVAKR